MKSSLPKVLHRLCGKPMLWHVLESAKAVTGRQVIITGYGSEKVREYFGEELFTWNRGSAWGLGMLSSNPCLACLKRVWPWFSVAIPPCWKRKSCRS